MGSVGVQFLSSGSLSSYIEGRSQSWWRKLKAHVMCSYRPSGCSGVSVRVRTAVVVGTVTVHSSCMDAHLCSLDPLWRRQTSWNRERCPSNRAELREACCLPGVSVAPPCCMGPMVCPLIFVASLLFQFIYVCMLYFLNRE